MRSRNCLIKLRYIHTITHAHMHTHLHTPKHTYTNLHYTHLHTGTYTYTPTYTPPPPHPSGRVEAVVREEECRIVGDGPHIHTLFHTLSFTHSLTHTLLHTRIHTRHRWWRGMCVRLTPVRWNTVPTPPKSRKRYPHKEGGAHPSPSP